MEFTIIIEYDDNSYGIYSALNYEMNQNKIEFTTCNDRLFYNINLSDISVITIRYEINGNEYIVYKYFNSKE